MTIENGIEFTGLVPRGDKAINERYRPCTFHEIVGNDANKAALAGWMEKGEKRSKSIMLVGSAGSGKTTTARVLALGLNCEHGDTVNPCIECPSCLATLSGNAMHIRECNMSSLSKKEDADEIIASMYNTAFTGRNNVWILDELQGMSTGSQNLMLKTLESPPTNTYIVMCTTNPEKIIKPLKTRCEQYVFRNPTEGEIKKMLSGVVKHEMPEMTKEQRVAIFEACKGLGYREILMKLERFMNGGGVDSLKEPFKPSYDEIAKAITRGNYEAVLEQLVKCEKEMEDNPVNEFSAENARICARAFLCNQIGYLMRNGDYDGAKRTLKAFRVFDRGFYQDANPLQTFKADLFEACLCIRGEM